MTGLPGRVVFGGPLTPLAQEVGFLEAPLDRVWPVMRAWLDELEAATLRYRDEHLGAVGIVDALARLDPLQTPPKRQLVAATRTGWTAHFANSHLGGDSQSWTAHLARTLGCRGVIATHAPPTVNDLPVTSLDLFGPGGDPATSHVRAVYAGVYDEGRWEFGAFGAEQPWEEPERYTARRIRDRFDRDLLLRYVAALGIHPDEPGWYGDVVLVETKALFRPRTTSVLDEQRRLGIRT